MTEFASLTRKSMFSGKESTMVFPLYVEQFNRAMAAWRAGVLIQDAFPTLTADEREFIMTGVTPEEWDAMCKELEE